MQKSSLPKLSARLKVLKMLEMPNDDISVKENLNIFPHSSKSANFLPYSHERDSIGRLISKNVESVLAEVSEVRKMKIIPCEKNQNNYRLIRRNHLIFPEIVKGNLKQTNLRRVKIFHSASSINNNKIFLHKNENSISKILHINTSAEKRTEEKTKSMLSFSKTEDNVEIENENQIYLTLQNDDLNKKKQNSFRYKNFKYNEATTDNFDTKFSRILPKIKKIREKKQVYESLMKPGPGFYNPNYSFLLKKIPAAKIAEIILKPSDLNPPLEKISYTKPIMPTKKNDLEFERDFAKLLREIDMQAKEETRKNKESLRDESLDWVIFDKKFIDDYNETMKLNLKNMKQIMQKIKDSSRLIF